MLPQFFRHFLPKLKSTFANTSGLYSRRSGHSARKVKPTDSASTGRKHHLSSNSVTGEPASTAPWDDYDDARQLHTGDRGDVEDGIDLQSLQEARARRRNSEHDDGIVVRGGNEGYNKNGFESVESITTSTTTTREERGNLDNNGFGR